MKTRWESLCLPARIAPTPNNSTHIALPRSAKSEASAKAKVRARHGCLSHRAHRKLISHGPEIENELQIPLFATFDRRISTRTFVLRRRDNFRATGRRVVVNSRDIIGTRALCEKREREKYILSSCRRSCLSARHDITCCCCRGAGITRRRERKKKTSTLYIHPSRKT